MINYDANNWYLYSIQSEMWFELIAPKIYQLIFRIVVKIDSLLLTYYSINEK